MIESIDLVPGDKGVYDVAIDGEVIFSKHDVGRHAEPGEVRALFEAHVGPPTFDG